jgi:hypothetical protein
MGSAVASAMTGDNEAETTGSRHSREAEGHDRGWVRACIKGSFVLPVHVKRAVCRHSAALGAFDQGWIPAIGSRIP